VNFRTAVPVIKARRFVVGYARIRVALLVFGATSFNLGGKATTGAKYYAAEKNALHQGVTPLQRATRKDLTDHAPSPHRYGIRTR
jgi:hypothetical protein